MDIASTTTATTTVPAASVKGSSSGSGEINSDFQTFLTMLTAQLQNQDPLNPIESADFAVQLATFSGVEQQVETNDLLADLVASMGSTGLTQLAGWVGMEARAAAPAYFYGEPVSLFPNPDMTADTAQVVVRNAFGTEVGRYGIDVSKDPVSWSGIGDGQTTLPDGLYTFHVESYSGTTLLSTRQAEVYSLITEARVENGETVLVLLGDTKIKSADVLALRNQPV